MNDPGQVNNGVFIDLLNRLLHNPKAPIFFIVDRHVTVKVRRFMD